MEYPPALRFQSTPSEHAPASQGYTGEPLYDGPYNDLGWRMTIGKVKDPEDAISRLKSPSGGRPTTAMR